MAFDHVGFTPHDVDAAARAGDFNSRCLNVGDRSWHDSASGQTVYLGARSQRKSRRLRVYNRHGFNRCEGEFRDEWARALALELSEKPPAEWPKIATGYLRGMIDFVDHNADERIERCPLLAWWAEFVGNVERIRNLPAQDQSARAEDDWKKALGKSEGTIIRNVRKLWAIKEAFGAQYLCDRIEYYAEHRITDEDRAFVKELERWRYSGLAGLPGDPPSDDIPF